jgi:O-antigen ligase
MPYTDTGAARRGKGWLWIIIPLVVIGFLVFALLFNFASRFQSSGLVLIALVLVGIPALLLLPLALRQGLDYARSFVPTLKWWHVLWALTVVSAMVFRRRTVDDINSNPLDAWAVYRVAVDMVVGFALLARLTLRRTQWLGSMFRGPVGALSVYGLVCLASTAWSVYPSWTIFKSFEYLVDIALLAAVLETLDSVDQYRNFFNWTWAIYAVLLLGVWKDVPLWPKEALYEGVENGAFLGIRLSGVLPAWSANDVGTFSSILAVLCLARLFPASATERFRKPWYTLLLLISLVSLVLSQTRIAVFGLLLAGLIILLYAKRGKLGAVVTLIVAPIVALITMGGVIWSFIARGQTAAQMNTLSSRTEWWGLAWQTFMQQPFTGFGAFAAGRFAVLAKAGFGETGTLHSDYLEVLVGTGFWGMIPLLVALIGTWWLLWRFLRDASDPQERQLAVEAFAILALLTLRSLFNNMMTVHPPLPFLVIVGYAEFLRRRRKAFLAYEPSRLRDLVTAPGDTPPQPFPD